MFQLGNRETNRYSTYKVKSTKIAECTGTTYERISFMYSREKRNPELNMKELPDQTKQKKGSQGDNLERTEMTS